VSKIKAVNQTCAATEDQIASLKERLSVTPTASAISSELLGGICTRGSVYTSLTHMEIAMSCGGFTLKQLSPSFVHAQVCAEVYQFFSICKSRMSISPLRFSLGISWTSASALAHPVPWFQRKCAWLHRLEPTRLKR
jgi:hypothetical protein